VIASTVKVLELRANTAYVLIDSIENLGPRLVSDENLKQALRGLFHLVGRTGRNDRGVMHIQCCFPSELWPLLKEYSANPIKDFSRKLALQWKGHDLLAAGDARVQQFLQTQFSEADLPEGATVETFLPRKVTNRLGREEAPHPLHPSAHSTATSASTLR